MALAGVVFPDEQATASDLRRLASHLEQAAQDIHRAVSGSGSWDSVSHDHLVVRLTANARALEAEACRLRELARWTIASP